MKRVYSITLGALLVAMCTGSAMAQSIICKMDAKRHTYYISPEVSLKIGSFNEVKVRDTIIKSTDRNMVIGTVSKDDSKRLSVYWEVRDVRPDPAETRAYGSHLLVRLTIQKASGAATMTVGDLQAGGRQYQYRAAGTCNILD